MPANRPSSRKPDKWAWLPYLALLLAAASGLVLTACGGSSHTATTTTVASEARTGRSATPTSITGHYTRVRSTSVRPTPPRSPGASAAASNKQLEQAESSLATCLVLHGVKLRSPGGLKGAPPLPLKGVDTKSPSYRSALAKCRPVALAAFGLASGKGKSGPTVTPSSGARSPRRTPTFPPGTVKIPASVTAGFQRFTACMRSHGVARFPEPEGASFNLSGTGVAPASPQYKAAQTACNSILQALDPRG